MRDTVELFEDERTKERLDRAIIEIMDIMRDETQLDIDNEDDGDDDDYLWGVVYGYVYGALREAYNTRLSLIKHGANKEVRDAVV